MGTAESCIPSLYQLNAGSDGAVPVFFYWLCAMHSPTGRHQASCQSKAPPRPILLPQGGVNINKSLDLARAGLVTRCIQPAMHLPSTTGPSFSRRRGGQSPIKQNGPTDLSAHLGACLTTPPRPIVMAQKAGKCKNRCEHIVILLGKMRPNTVSQAPYQA